MAGLQESSAFILELGDAEPEENQTPQYRNFVKYAKQYGQDSFQKDCN